jgi:hypothetical protein
MNQWRTCACVLGALLLTGCTAAGAAGHATGQTAAGTARATGHVTGKLLMEGGPMGPGGQQPGERPLSGTVTFTAAGHRPVAVRVGPSGKFSVGLQPGRYRVAGRSPDIETVTVSGRDVEQTCTQSSSMIVGAGQTVTTVVVCSVP